SLSSVTLPDPSPRRRVTGATRRLGQRPVPPRCGCRAGTARHGSVGWARPRWRRDDAGPTAGLGARPMSAADPGPADRPPGTSGDAARSGVPRATPLRAVLESLGASMTPFAGWLMPLRYRSEIAEHQAVRNAAGLFDLSHMGEIAVTGPGAAG